MVAVGPLAETTEPHELGHALGKGRPSSGSSPWREGPCCWVPKLVPHYYAEAVADIPKRWVTYEMPMLGRNGEVARKTAIRIRFKTAFSIALLSKESGCGQNYSKCLRELGRHREGVVGLCFQCYLFDAQDIVTFGVTYLEALRATRSCQHKAAQRSCEPSG